MVTIAYTTRRGVKISVALSLSIGEISAASFFLFAIITAALISVKTPSAEKKIIRNTAPFSLLCHKIEARLFTKCTIKEGKMLPVIMTSAQRIIPDTNAYGS